MYIYKNEKTKDNYEVSRNNNEKKKNCIGDCNYNKYTSTYKSSSNDEYENDKMNKNKYNKNSDYKST